LNLFNSIQWKYWCLFILSISLVATRIHSLTFFDRCNMNFIEIPVFNIKCICNWNICMIFFLHARIIFYLFTRFIWRFRIGMSEWVSILVLMVEQRLIIQRRSVHQQSTNHFVPFSLAVHWSSNLFFSWK
jgi:hypothetical protein